MNACLLILKIYFLSNKQNYTAGDPSPVLYIKNLAKDVVVDDFYFMFGELSSISSSVLVLSINLATSDLILDFILFCFSSSWVNYRTLFIRSFCFISSCFTCSRIIFWQH